MPNPQNISDRLISRLADVLGTAAATEVVGALSAMTGGNQAAAVLTLLDELSDVSPKATRCAMEGLPELQRRGLLDVAVLWLDLGIALAGTSGAAAMRYFNESPVLLGVIEPPPHRAACLRVALEVADTDANVALECFRTLPELLREVPLEGVGAWTDLALELARLDFVLAVELIRQSPAVARVLPVSHVRDWVAFGMTLVTENSLGKTDYLGTLEFFRTSPALLRDIDGQGARLGVIALGAAVARESPAAGMRLLAEAPGILRRLPSEAWREKVLQYGLLVAERDAEATLAYLGRAPELLALIGEDPEATQQFDDWFKGGMEVLGYSPDGGRAYFALETKKALASIEQAMSGMPLRWMARSLKLFAEGMCGTDVAIAALPDSARADEAGPARATVSADGRTIRLPAILRRYRTRDQNARLFLVMTAHEAGHLEFGTYELSLDTLRDLIAEVRTRYAREERETQGSRNTVATLAELFALYPQPALIRDLWTLLEDARVEYLLRLEYPGLKGDLAELAREAVTTRSLLHGMSVRELVVDALLLLTTAEPGSFRIPESVTEVVAQVWAQCRAILRADATAEDTVRLADGAYVTLDRMVTRAVAATSAGEDEPATTDLGAGPGASETQSDEYRSITNWAYRGEMNPEAVGQPQRAAREPHEPSPEAAAPEAARRPAAAGLTATGLTPGRSPRREAREGRQIPETMGMAHSPGAAVQDALQVEPHQAGEVAVVTGGVREFIYDEWDGGIQDYRAGWCRVIEAPAPEGSVDFAERTLTDQAAAVRLLRRYFEHLRPPAMRRVHGQMDGEELDLDAVVRRRADLLAGADADDRIYLRREARDRDVAAAFLVDLSGSTSRQVESDQRRVIDIEKEGVVLLCEALEAVGDQYAVYGYSGQGRSQVDFVVIKDFDDRVSGPPARRIGALAPQRQNRDGAAIRHATRRLLARSAKTRLLVVISDGRPLDDGYADEYSLEDTKMALREARMAGIHPFCITVDRAADDYLRRMYGDVRFLVIDRVAALPEQLPRMYKRLTT